MKETFLLYTNMRSAFETMTDEDAGKIIKALFADQSGDAVQLDGLLNTVFTQIKTQVEYNNAKYDCTKQARAEAGRKGGIAKASKGKQSVANGSKAKQIVANGSKAKQSLPNDNDNDNDNVLPKGNINIIPTPEPKKEEKHKYGEYNNVLLTDAEYTKLAEQFPKDFKEWINRLSGYIESKGAKYKSHYATILNWSRRDSMPSGRASPKNSFNDFRQDSVDYDALEKLMGG